MSVKRKEHVQANLDLVDRSLQYLREHPPAGETPLLQHNLMPEIIHER
jgi:hypothetical protein